MRSRRTRQRGDLFDDSREVMDRADATPRFCATEPVGTESSLRV